MDAEHVTDIDALLESRRGALHAYYERGLDSLREDEQAAIEGVFNDFGELLGPVGAAKALHLYDRSRRP